MLYDIGMGENISVCLEMKQVNKQMDADDLKRLGAEKTCKQQHKEIYSELESSGMLQSQFEYAIHLNCCSFLKQELSLAYQEWLKYNSDCVCVCVPQKNTVYEKVGRMFYHMEIVK